LKGVASGKRRRSAVAATVLIALVAVLTLNALVTSDETAEAEVTMPGAKILELPGGDLQILDRGPRRGTPIVLLHGWTCAIDWWDRMMPLLEERHRVVAIDLLGHGGSEKPAGGYSMENQAELVAQALRRLGLRRAIVVGHSMGAVVGTALSEVEPSLTSGLAIVDQAPANDGYGSDLPLTAAATFTPVIGEALWQLSPDFAIEDGLSLGFAPGYEVPDRFVEDFRRLTYEAYDASAEAETAYMDARPLDARLRRSGIRLLAVFGAEEQIYSEPEKALAAYEAIGAQTELVQGAGHSPNVERPKLTAALVSRFAATKKGRPDGRPK
jgi:pimeloyl-ACP methyl ester carboxylesterase